MSIPSVPQHKAMPPYLASGIGDVNPEPQGPIGWPAKPEIHPDLLAGYVRSDPESDDVSGRTPLEMDALPDSPNRTVPALLPVGDLGKRKLGKEIGVVTGIYDSDDELIT